MRTPTKFGSYVHQYIYDIGDYDFGVQSWVYSILKNGKEGKSTKWILIPYTPLRVCSKCGKFGKKNRIQSWGLFERMTGNKQLRKVVGEGEVHYPMCLSCANKLRPAIRARNEYIDTCYTINKVKHFIYMESKNGN